MCQEYVASEKGRLSSKELLKKVMMVFGEFGARTVVDEVTGRNVGEKIEELLKKQEKKKGELSDFDKKIKKALAFDPKK